MAKVQRITHVDDLTGLDIPDGESVINRELTWQGKTYELDLTAESAEKVDAALEQIVKNATPVSRSGKRTSAQRNEAGKIREWAKSQGLNVANRGRLNPAVVAAYRAGHVTEELRIALGVAKEPEADKEADQAPAPEKPKRSRSRAKKTAEPVPA